MNQLVQVKEGKATTTSLLVAEKFNKRHADVLRNIDKLSKLKPDFTERNFALSSYVGNDNVSVPMYHMTEEGFALIAMRFTGDAALDWQIKFIEAFQSMRDEKGMALTTAIDNTILERRITALENKLNQPVQQTITPEKKTKPKKEIVYHSLDSIDFNKVKQQVISIVKRTGINGIPQSHIAKNCAAFKKLSPIDQETFMDNMPELKTVINDSLLGGKGRAGKRLFII